MPRNEVIEFKVTAEEKKEIKAKADRGAISVSELARAALLNFFPEAPVRYETPTDMANKAKVREAVENEEPYEVKVEPSTLLSDRTKTAMQDAERDSWIASTARILMMEKGLSKVAATMQASKEWDAR